MKYTIKHKNLMQFCSPSSFNDRLTEALKQNVCNNEDTLKKALAMSNEILNSGTPLKIKQLFFKVESSSNKKPFVGKQRV